MGRISSTSVSYGRGKKVLLSKLMYFKSYEQNLVTIFKHCFSHPMALGDLPQARMQAQRETRATLVTVLLIKYNPDQSP